LSEMSTNMNVQELYQNALKFAARKHSMIRQKVPGTRLPYVVHLSNVAMEILIASSPTKDFDLSLALQVALLHDVLEDTFTSRKELEEAFGIDVTEGVVALTENRKLPKEERMPDYIRRIKHLSHEIWAVKMADRITNLQPPPKNWSKEKRIRYQEEARIIHQELKDGNEYLAERLVRKIKEYSDYIK
jgi:guanosine-3',5'-bis(diphosphate) 3'-pyrophosphohydrolase